MIKKICPICGQEFATTEKRLAEGRGVYCSRECQFESMRKQVRVTCRMCGKIFSKTLTKANKCETHLCKECIEKTKVKDTQCPICGKVFHPAKNGIIYCSRKCANIAKQTGNEILKNDEYAELVIKSPKYGIKKCLISLSSVDKVSQMTWQVKYTKSSDNFYVHSSKCYGKSILLHRYITNCPNDLVVDHINHNTLDNRLENLRITTTRGNALNINSRKDNTSGAVGVRKLKNGQFAVYLSKERKAIFNTLEDAAVYRDKLIQKEIKKETGS